MTKLMYIISSPRGERSHSIALAEAFLNEYTRIHPDTEVMVRNLFEMDLPQFDGETIKGKYNIMHGQEFTPEEQAKWKAVEALIEDFKSADVYLFAVPMWNFNIPYRLKHYFDLIIQPGYTIGTMEGRKVVVANARGNTYEPGSPKNYLEPYITFLFEFMGITDVHVVAAQGMLIPEREPRKDSAEKEIRELAAKL